MLFLLGISLLGTVGSKFVPANSVHNISIETTNDRVEWKENGNTVLLLSYDSNTDGCGAHPQNPNFNGYCINKGQTYVLEILNTSNHDKSVFTGNQEICTIDYSASIPEMNFSSKVLEEVKPIHIEMIVLLTKPKPSLKLIFTAKDLTGNITEKEIESCGNTLTNYSISYDLYISNVRVVFQRDDISEFSLIACPYYGDLEDEYFGPASTPTIIKTAVPKCNECCRCYYNLIVLIIIVALIVLVIIVVIIHFRRREAKKCGTVYWALNILLIIGVLGCVILAIVQIVYLTKASEDCCQDTCQDTCQEKAGYDAAIAFVVIGFIKAVLGIVVLILRLKNRDQKKETTDTEMKPGSEKEKNRTSDRPLPAPKRT